MTDDLSSEVSITISSEDVGKTVSALRMLFDSIEFQSKSESFEDVADALKDEAERTRKLMDKYGASSGSSADSSYTITREELRRSISALQLAVATSSEEAERDNPSRPADELTNEAEGARALIKKIRASAQ